MSGLTGPQIGKIRDAILTAFTLDTFADFLLVRLDKRLDVIAGKVPFEQAALAVVQRASFEGWDVQLLEALRESRPHMASVFVVASERGIESLPLEETVLERKIKEHKPDADYSKVLARIGSLRNRICQISYQVDLGTVNGTGFLVGPSTVITNRHVVQRVMNGECQPASVVLRFDYYRAAGGLGPNIGTAATLASDSWLIDSSPHDPLDVDAAADPNSARPEEALDYALLKLSEPLGSLPVGYAESGSENRGWIFLSSDAKIPAFGDVVFVFQHPDGQPLKWAQPDVVSGINVNQTRIRYSVNTEGGSSGSPVFDATFGLIALHHAGDPNFEPLHNPQFNQGIPVSKIAARLSVGGHAAWLGDSSEGNP